MNGVCCSRDWRFKGYDGKENWLHFSFKYHDNCTCIQVEILSDALTLKNHCIQENRIPHILVPVEGVCVCVCVCEEGVQGEALNVRVGIIRNIFYG